MKKALLWLLFSTVLLLTGCVQDGDISEAETIQGLESAADAEETQEQGQLATEKTADEIVFIDEATAEKLEKYSSYYTYVHQQDGGEVLISTTETLRFFEFIAIEADIIDGELHYYPSTVYFALDRIDPDHPFVVRFKVTSEVISHHGISFVDPDNVRRYYVINIPGRGKEEAGYAYYLTEFDF